MVISKIQVKNSFTEPRLRHFLRYGTIVNVRLGAISNSMQETSGKSECRGLNNVCKSIVIFGLFRHCSSINVTT